MAESMEDFAGLLEKSFNKVYNGDVLEGTVIEVQSDALLLDVHSYMDGVLPYTELYYEGQEKETYREGDSLTVMVTKVDSRNGMIYLSKIKADAVVIWDTLASFRDELTPIDVQVKEVVKGGLRIQYKGVRGFLPQFQIGFGEVGDLSDYVGRTLTCLVNSVDPERKDVVVSRKSYLRKEKEIARKQLLENLKVGQTVEGRVRRLERYGAFVEIAPGLDGLLHISEISATRIRHPSDVLKEGDEVRVTVIGIDRDQERISLRMKDIGQAAAGAEADPPREEAASVPFYGDDDEGFTMADAFKGLKLN